MSYVTQVLLQDNAFPLGSIMAADIASVTAVGQDGCNIVSGVPTPGSFISISMQNMGTARIQISGTWVGQIIFEFSVDNGVNWQTAAFQVNGTIYTRNTFTANGTFMGDASGCTNFRARAIAWTSGIADVVGVFSTTSGTVKINNAIRLVDNVTGLQASITADGLKVNGTLALPAGAATEAKQDTGNTSLATIAAKDFATQTTLAALLAKVIVAPATEAKQDTGNTSLSTIAAKDFATQTTLAALLAKVIAAPATEAKQDTGNTSLATIAAKDFATQTTLAVIAAKDFATQTTLAALLAKVIAAPATEAKQDTGNTSLATIAAKDFATQTTLAVIAAKDFATQTTLAALLAKVIAAPATEAKQDIGNTSLATIAAKDFATETTLAALLAKVIVAPATEAKQDIGNTSLATIAAKDFATQTTLAAVLAKIIAAPATEAKQDTGNTSLATIAAKDFATQTTLAALLAKVIAAPATEAKQDTGNTSLATIAAKDFATQTTLAALLAKVIAAPATEAKQDTGNSSLAIIASGSSATGVITIQNANPLTGVPTVGSFVRLTLNNQAAAAIIVSGIYTGALSLQYSTDGGTTWITFTNALQLALATTGTPSATIASAAVGAWFTNVTGLTDIRITALAAVTGNATVTIKGVFSAQQIGINQALPAGANSIGTVVIGSGTVTTVSTVTTVGSVTSSNRGIPGIIADIAAAAISVTTTTAAVTPTFGSTYQVSIPVTAVSGTLPTLDVQIQESDDSGTNWFAVYDFPRITATGMFRSPKLTLRGNRVRYVQTISGTTPSFTRAINRLQESDSVNGSISQMIDRTVVINTLNSVTPSLNTQNARNLQLVVNVGAITTTAPQFQLQGSEDNGATWTNTGAALLSVANSTVQLTVNNINFSLVRVLISVAGVGATAGFVLVKGF